MSSLAAPRLPYLAVCSALMGCGIAYEFSQLPVVTSIGSGLNYLISAIGIHRVDHLKGFESHHLFVSKLRHLLMSIEPSIWLVQRSSMRIFNQYFDSLPPESRETFLISGPSEKTHE